MAAASRWRRRLGRPALLVAVLTVLSLVLAGCGGSDEGPTGLAELTSADEADDSGTNANAEDSSDTATDTDESSPEDATDTDGTDTEGSDTPTVTDDRSGFALDPVAGDDDGQSLHDLLLGLHGPTTDVAAQVNRLTSFPGVPTPDGGGVIIDLSTLQDPADGQDPADPATIRSSSRVSFYTEATPGDLVVLYQDAFAAWGYTTVKTTDETTDGATSTTLFLELGEEPSRPKSEVTITDQADSELTLVKIQHTEQNGQADRYLELGRWASAYAPDGAPLVRVQVGSTFGTLSTGTYNQVQLDTRWEVDGDQAVTTPLAQELAAESGSDFEQHTNGAYVFAGPVDRIDITGNNDSMSVDMVFSIDGLVDPLTSGG